MMEQETIDDSYQSMPTEAMDEIKGAARWITISGILAIIFAILGLLGNITTMVSGGAGTIIISVISNGVSIYLGFLMIRTSEKLNNYTESREEDSLMEGIRLTRLYWMISVLLVAVSFVFSFSQQ